MAPKTRENEKINFLWLHLLLGDESEKEKRFVRLSIFTQFNRLTHLVSLSLSLSFLSSIKVIKTLLFVYLALKGQVINVQFEINLSLLTSSPPCLLAPFISPSTLVFVLVFTKKGLYLVISHSCSSLLQQIVKP